MCKEYRQYIKEKKVKTKTIYHPDNGLGFNSAEVNRMYSLAWRSYVSVRAEW